mmetsp:Transcript_14661/g.12065  ORF Transcript_14661/g.12065 Transcript_14661/m.12065 type:complete len:113 (+) Transcript_14661:729-1067(+)
MKFGRKGKTKEELYQLRKQMMQPKSKPKKLEVIDEFMNNSMKMKGSNELMSRLAYGNKTCVGERESKSRSKNMYNKLPEQMMKQEEKKKQQDMIQRQRKMQEYAQNVKNRGK